MDGRNLAARYRALAREAAVLRTRIALAADGYRAVDRSVFTRMSTLIRLASDMLRRDPSPDRPVVVDGPVFATGVRVAALPQGGAGDPYAAWWAAHAARHTDLEAQRELQRWFPRRPRMSIVMPTYQSDLAYLRAAIASVREQSYPEWELCIADDASPDPRVAAALAAEAQADTRVRVVVRETNGHIARATNTALTLATGEFVGFLDHDDMLTPDALFWFVAAFNDQPDADMFYSDEDKIAPDGTRREPHFKPGWSPEGLLCRNYTSHFSVYRRALVAAVGGLRPGFEGSQDFDLALRVTERSDRIVHVPRVLYGWRVHPQSTAGSSGAKSYAYDAGRRAVKEALARRGVRGTVDATPGRPGYYAVCPQPAGDWSVDIVVFGTRSGADAGAAALRALLADGRIGDVVVAADDNALPSMDARIDAASVGGAPFVLFLHAGAGPVDLSWIAALCGWCAIDGVGAAGSRVVDERDAIVDGPRILGLTGAFGVPFVHEYTAADGALGWLLAANNVSALDFGAAVVRRTAMDAARARGPFAYTGAAGELEFGLRLREDGMRLVATTQRVRRTAAQPADADGLAAFALEHAAALAADPYYNVNLSLASPSFSPSSGPEDRVVLYDASY